MDLTRAGWRKASYSNTNGGECVEVRAAETVDVRDSKDPGGSVLAFTAQDWKSFTASVRAGRLDLA